jgi:3-polyprenyl-4-hydroxybenzoate decarboxylase
MSSKRGICPAVYFKCSTIVSDLIAFSVATVLDEIAIVHESIQQNAPMLELT